MPVLDRSDLKYDYTWSTEPAQKPRTETTTENGTRSRMFRRDDGDEVLDFINEYAEQSGIENKAELLEIEALIRDRLKDREMTREELRSWLDDRLQKV